MNTLIYKATLDNSNWGTMELTCDNDKITIDCGEERVTMSKEDFENLTYYVTKYYESLKTLTN